jgi:hypothetical protein
MIAEPGQWPWLVAAQIMLAYVHDPSMNQLLLQEQRPCRAAGVW